jgi:hypothetical protein
MEESRKDFRKLEEKISPNEEGSMEMQEATTQRIMESIPGHFMRTNNGRNSKHG